MKKLTILPLLFALSLSAQELPEANKKVLEYAKSKIGKRVGRGICFNMVDSALCQLNPQWKSAPTKSDTYKFGEKIKFKNVMPGDILYESNGGGALDHVCVVALVSKTDKGIVITAISGNVRKGKDTLKASTTEYTTYNFYEDVLYENWAKRKLTFYRPI